MGQYLTGAASHGPVRVFTRGALLALGCLVSLLIWGPPSARATPTITEFSAGITPGSSPDFIAAGPDGNLWFTENAASQVARITTAGSVTEFSTGITAGSHPSGLTAGPDGNLWFTENSGDRVGRITTAGAVTEFSNGITPSSQPGPMTVGSDGNLWFTEYTAGQLARVSPDGTVTEFSNGITPGRNVGGIISGPDGNLWFTERNANCVGRMTTAGVGKEFCAGISSPPAFITSGPDGNLWFTEDGGDRIGRITTSGTVTEFSAGITPGSAPYGITDGPDGAIWFTERDGNRIGRITTSGIVSEFFTGITPGSTPLIIVSGPDGNLWFTEETGPGIGRVNIGAGAGAGPVDAWGDDTSGELGVGNTAPATCSNGVPCSPAPVAVSGQGGTGTLSGVVAVSTGDGFSLALKSDGTVWAWGSNGGALGDGSTNGPVTTPVQVVGPGGQGVLSGVVAIAAGGSGSSFALKSDGSVWAWGYNGDGELGDNSTTNSSTPVQVVGPGGQGVLSGVVAIAAGANHSLAVKSDGSVWAWGFDGAGQLGNNSTVESLVPVQVVGTGGTGTLSGVIGVAAGFQHSLAVKSDGSVWSWGANVSGQLGNGSGGSGQIVTTPVQVVGGGGTGTLSGVVQVAAGGFHSLALKSDGSVWAWGDNTEGQLGVGTFTGPETCGTQSTCSTTPTQVVGPGGSGTLAGVAQVAAGSSYSLALKSDGSVWTWGFDNAGQLGNGSTGSTSSTGGSDSPVQVVGSGGSGTLSGVTTLGTGEGASHALATVAAPPTPAITGISPPSGPATGGTQVTISGSGFAGATAINFGGTAVTSGFTVNGAGTQITVPSPPGAGVVDVTVTTPGGTSPTSSADRFSYVPVLTAVSPSSGAATGGTQVTISGSGFAGATAINFGGTAVTSGFTVNGAGTQITVPSPPGAGVVDVTVTTPGGTSPTSSADRFSYVPVLTAVSPSSGPATGGTQVTISGSGFAGATAINFGGTAVTSGFTVNGAGTQITVPSPPGAGVVDVTVTTPGGTSPTSSADRFTYLQPPPPPPQPPGATAVTASAHSSTTASFSGAVQPNGQATSAHFEYGLDNQYRPAAGAAITYDQSTQDQTIPSGVGSQVIAGNVSGLVPNALYHVRLVAVSAGGTTDGPDQTFMTLKDPPPPPPVLGQTVNTAPESGLVLIKLPAGAVPELSGRAAPNKGQGFVPLTEARQIPSGSQVDARRGSLEMITASGTLGKTQNGVFARAIFGLTQDGSGISKGLTTLSLLEGAVPGGPSYSSCSHRAADGGLAAFAARSNKVLQTLRASAHGHFRTRGRYAAATVRGTAWTTTDRCDGTLIAVQRHTVEVTDFVRRVSVLVRAGHSYLARANRR